MARSLEITNIGGAEGRYRQTSAALGACLLVFAVAVVLDWLSPLASELVIVKGLTDAVEFT